MPKNLNTKMLKVGVIGGTGYTGIELLRLLVEHPQVNIKVVTSRAEQGLAVTDVMPGLRGCIDLNYSAPDSDEFFDCDIVFFATPNATAMYQVPKFVDADIKVIDLSADFRINDLSIWQQWYGQEHDCPDLLESAVYGLPELYREAIKSAVLVANPGCYPTAIILALLPVLSSGLVDLNTLIADAKSGVSGAGRKASVSGLYAEVSESFKAYSVSGHRHLPEITQVLSTVTNDNVNLTFVPHLVPMTRGIHATVYANLTGASTDLQEIYSRYFVDEAFVDVMPMGSHPDTGGVKGTNLCRLAIHEDKKCNRVIILSVIDNLVKGAAGQAIQNMNIMSGFDEAIGLTGPAFNP